MTAEELDEWGADLLQFCARFAALALSPARVTTGLASVAAGQALAGPSQPFSPSNYRLAASIEAGFWNIG